jgi:hypothetical protein
VKASGDFGGVALVVKSEESAKNLVTSGYRNSKAAISPLPVEVVRKVKVLPAVSFYHRTIKLGDARPKF